MLARKEGRRITDKKKVIMPTSPERSEAPGWFYMKLFDFSRIK
jgi:hypothetical protein